MSIETGRPANRAAFFYGQDINHALPEEARLQKYFAKGRKARDCGRTNLRERGDMRLLDEINGLRTTEMS